MSHLEVKHFEYLKTLPVTKVIQGVSKILDKYQEWFPPHQKQK